MENTLNVSREARARLLNIWLPVCMGLVVSVIALSPVLIHSVTLTSQDEMFHLARIESLAVALRHGVFPAKLRPSLLYTYGYGVGFFYPDFFLYLPAGLMCLGLSLKHAYQVYLIVSVVLAYTLTTFSVYRLSGSGIAGMVSGSLATTATVFLGNLYDGSAGMIIAYAFFSAAICGFFLLLKREKYGMFLFCLGILGCLLSHVISFVMLLFTGVLLLLLSAPLVMEAPVILAKIIKSGVYCMLFGAAFLLPMFEQMAHTLYVGMSDRRIYDIREHVASLSELISSMGMPLFLLIMITIPGIGYLHRKKQNINDLLALLVTVLLLVVAACSRKFWSLAHRFLGFLQVSVRLSSAISVLGVILIGLTYAKLLSVFLPNASGTKKRVVMIATMTGCILAAFLMRKSVDPGLFREAPKSYEIAWDAVQSTGLEWIPYDCYVIDPAQSERSEEENRGGADGVKHDDGTYYDVYVDLSHEYYDVPYLYYYGYQAYLADDALNPMEVLTVGKGANGMTRVFLPEGGEGIGHILVTYRKTVVQKLAYCISLMTLFATVVILAFQKHKSGQRATMTDR